MQSSPFHESLNGTWKLAAPNANDTAFPESFPHDIPVPGLVDLASGYDYKSARFHYYSREIGADIGQGFPHVDLVLDQSMWTTAVWCNGRFSAMTNECFLPQRFPLAGALKADDTNRLVVRIGQVDTLPTRHVAGNDYERLEWFPGIWGDARLHRYGTYQITGVLIVPEEDLGGCLVRVRVRRASKGKAPAIVRLSVRNGIGMVAGGEARTIPLDGNVETEVRILLRWSSAAPWHPSTPNLYDLIAEVFEEGGSATPTDRAERRFGIRRFSVRGRDLILNGERIRLRGGNVAFHRLLGDPLRGALPWDPSFARRAISEIPRQHNMNCLRVHIGSMYAPWYDEVDASGMMLLEEWPFWNVTASPEDVYGTFSKWIWAMNHHPSIVMWDPGNECDLTPVLEQVIPAMKELDPSRAWVHAEMDEEHPYHWALIPLHPRRAMGFTRSHEEIRDGERPSSVNEFGWFWTDGEGTTTSLTEGVRQRWLPDGLSAEEHLAYQAWLVRECTEVWRRYDVASIHPFIYLSTSRGLTGNWFLGNLGDLKLKPVVKAFAESIAPLGVSYEVTGRHYLSGERVKARLFLFNDLQHQANLSVRFGFADADRRWIGDAEHLEMMMQPVSTRIIDVTFKAPFATGNWRLLACVDAVEGIGGVSEKCVEVLPTPKANDSFRQRYFHIIGDDPELSEFLRDNGATLVASAHAATTVIISGAASRSDEVSRFVAGSEEWLRNGGRLVLLQPDSGVTEVHSLRIGDSAILTTTPYFDKDAGGYDTVAIPTTQAPPALLHQMPARHLGYFNGGIGNIIAEESDISLGELQERWLICGLERKRTVVAGLRIGEGLVIASRLQLQGRLTSLEVADFIGEERYPRFPDPLAQQLLLNLLSI